MKPVHFAPTPAALSRPEEVEAGRISAAVAFLIVEMLALLLALVACGGERVRPGPPASATPGPGYQPAPDATRLPERASTLAAPPPVLWSRSLLAAPVSVTVDYARTFVIQHLEGAAEYTRTVGSAAWGDLHLYWQHPDPAQVDYYEVYTTTNMPYFTVPVSATLALTTTAQRGVFLESPARFNPVPQSGDPGARSEFDYYVIRAVNAAGVSAPSWPIGVVIYSLIAAPYNWTTNAAGFPTPLPTRGPTPTPIPTHTRTPVPTGTAGPSPTPPGG